MTDSKVVDSSVWLDYFFNDSSSDFLQNNSNLLTSAISIFEIKKKFKSKNVSEQEITEKINFVKEKSIIINVDEKICSQGADISFAHSVPAIDSIIYSTAKIANATLLTRDNDFHKLPNVEILRD